MNDLRRSRRQGLTLVELLVVFAVIGILIAILLVAVQASRESGSRLSCQSNLRQLAIAVAAYENSHRVFPSGSAPLGNNLHVSILPFIEQEAIYSELLERYSKGIYSPPTSLFAIATFLCPSDPAPSHSLPLIGTNYTGNSGTWLISEKAWGGVIVPWRNMSNERIRIVRAADITDGLSNTSMISELLRADGSHHRLRVGWHTPSTYTDIDVFARVCREIPNDPVSFGWTGDPWLLGTPWTYSGVTVTLYNHVLPPNQPTCFNGGGAPEAAASVASLHRGGVNVVYADGSTRFTSNTVSVAAWRAIGTRNDGD
jgi:prepilin-type N-terminal cleavage/methylation domain-containing protein/prepilin-type processing-associated H-X9-DG protein